MFALKYALPLLAAAPLAFGGCNEIRKFTGLSHDEDRIVYPAQAYAPSAPVYGQPAYGQPAVGGYNTSEFQFNNPVVQQNVASQFPTTGHWEWGTSPDGRRTRIWIPDNSYKLPAEAYGPNVPQPWAPPRYDGLYSAARGRYDTIRLPDGRLEHEWRADEPASPAQGYWQVLNNGYGPQRTWVPSVTNVASDR
jgi:hypothetical protein